MPLDYNTVETIKFLVESEEKRSKLRMKWLRDHKEKIERAATLQRPATNYDSFHTTRAAMVADMPTITRDHAVASRHRRKLPIRDAKTIPDSSKLLMGHSIPEVGLGDPKEDPRLAKLDTDLTPEPKMRPIDPEQKAIIYKGLPRFGRPAYLYSRNKIAPEKKYYFMESSGWEYGWRLGDSYFARHAPSYGRTYILTEGTRSRSGPHPDPPYYNSLNKSGNSKCSSS